MAGVSQPFRPNARRAALPALNGCRRPPGIAACKRRWKHWAPLSSATPTIPKKVLPLLWNTVILPPMSNEERRAKTRERVKAWKEKNPWLVKHQNKRRWQRTLATRVHPTPEDTTRVRFEGNTGTERKPVREVQETVYVDMDEVEADPKVMAQHREGVMARFWRNAPPPIPPGPMEPVQEGGHTDVIEENGDTSRAAPETHQQLPEEDAFAMTPEEKRAAFEVMKRTYHNAGWHEIGSVEIEMP